MNRRNLLSVLGAALFTPRAVFAQIKKPPKVIGWLHFGSKEKNGPRLDELKSALARHGWKEGVEVTFEERWADGRFDRLQALAEDLARRRPAVIVAAPSQPVAAVAKAAPSTPIVQAFGSDPVSAGFASNLARPGGMITGLSNMVTDVQQKFVELLLAASPNVKRIGFLIDSTTYARRGLIEGAKRSAARFGVDARLVEVAKADEIGPAIARLAKEGAQALAVMSSPLFAFERAQVVRLALTLGLPMIAGGASFSAEGALLSYSADLSGNYRRAAFYVDRILRGANPAQMPIEQPTTFLLVVNLKTAKALGLTMPPEIMVQATHVIQ